MDTDAELREIVEAFVGQLKGLLRRATLETVQAALGDDAPRRGGRRRAAKAGGKKGATPGARKKGAKRTPDELEGLTKSLLAYVRKNPGQRIEPIAKGLGVTTKELALPAKKLIAEKRFATKGQRRATTYFAK